MKTVWKYQIEMPPRGVCEVDMPDGSAFLHVDKQMGRVFAWFECDSNALPVTRSFRLVGTGEALRPGGWHLGTVLFGDALVIHLYEAAA